MYRIVNNKGHYDVVDNFGEVVCSCDSHQEAKEELEEMLKEEK